MTFSSPELARIGGISHAFFGREGGVSEGIYASLNCGIGSQDEPARVQENRRRAAAQLGVEGKSLSSLYQVHGTEVLTLTAPLPLENRPKADGAVTNVPGLAIGILTADCAPVLFADQRRKVVGACHAGWRGALGGITDQTVRAMEAIGANRADIVAAIGPTIGQSSYEVGTEFLAAFIAADAGNSQFFAPGKRPEKHQFDLPGYLHARLTALGLAVVEDLAADTAPEASPFFSFRRTTLGGGGDYGRQISAIAIRKE